MMIKMVLENLSNALKNAKKHHVKVRHQAGEIYLVYCDNPEHKEPHAVFFQERADGVYAACDCASRVACYHLLPAWNLREHVLEVQRAAKDLHSNIKVSKPAAEALSRNAQMDNSLITAAPRGPVERCGGIRV